MNKFENAKPEAMRLLDEVIQPIEAALRTRIRKKKLETAANKIPFLARIINDAKDASKALIRLNQFVNTLRNTVSSELMTQGSQIGVLALGVLDFFLIPIVYLASYLLHEEVPFTLSNNARWLYATVLLSLTVAALLFPPAGIVIGLTSASITLAVSLFLMGRILHERYQLNKASRALNDLIMDAEQEMQSLQTQANELRVALNKAQQEQEYSKIYYSITLLHERFVIQKELLLNLKKQKLDLKQKLDGLGFWQIFDRGFALSLTSLGLIGLVITLFLPSAGLAMLAAVSLACVTYIAGRLSMYTFKNISYWIHSKPISVSDEAAYDEENQLLLSPEAAQSTDSMLQRMSVHEKMDNTCLREDSMDEDSIHHPPLFATPREFNDKTVKSVLVAKKIG